MNKIIVAILMLAGSFAFADHHEEAKAGKFADRKAKTLAKIEKRIEVMNTHKSCVSAAADHKALKACRATMKTTRSEWKEERQERRKNRKSK